MRHPIEICLAACEWVEEKRGEASARRWRQKTEQKAIWTFLSQGAVGGAFVSFLVAFSAVVSRPSGYNIVFIAALPVYLVSGSVCGALVAGFVWLPGALFQRRLGFVARTVCAIAGSAALAVVLASWNDTNETRQPLSWWLGYICLLGLPVAFMTGSRIRPCRTMIFGAGRRPARGNFGNWLSIPFGFLLRSASIFGLLEALLVLGLWICNRRVGWLWVPAPEHLPAIILAVLCFAASSYFSISTPRKFFLLPTLIIVNAPLVWLIAYLQQLGTLDNIILSCMLLAVICLWVIYTLGRLISPESPRRVVDSWHNAVGTQQIAPSGGCQVQA